MTLYFDYKYGTDISNPVRNRREKFAVNELLKTHNFSKL